MEEEFRFECTSQYLLRKPTMGYNQPIILANIDMSDLVDILDVQGQPSLRDRATQELEGVEPDSMVELVINRSRNDALLELGGSPKSGFGKLDSVEIQELAFPTLVALGVDLNRLIRLDDDFQPYIDTGIILESTANLRLLCQIGILNRLVNLHFEIYGDSVDFTGAQRSARNIWDRFGSNPEGLFEFSLELANGVPPEMWPDFDEDIIDQLKAIYMYTRALETAIDQENIN